MTQRLFSLCASHIDSAMKVYKLKKMLVSWDNQTHKIPMILSISCDEKLHKVFEVLIGHLSKYSYLTIHDERYTKRTQFVHYKLICERYHDVLRDTWVIFTDDDDIWMSSRSQTFVNYMNEFSSVDFILYPYVYQGRDYIHNAEDVTKNLYKSRDDNVSEYVCFCVKFHVLQKFVNEGHRIFAGGFSNDDMLNHTFGDRYFICFLKVNSKSNYKKVVDGTLDGIYYYHNSHYEIMKGEIDDKGFLTYIE